MVVLAVFQMKKLYHNNICEFIGACLELNVTEIILVFEYCSRGTLMVDSLSTLSECLSDRHVSHFRTVTDIEMCSAAHHKTMSVVSRRQISQS